MTAKQLAMVDELEQRAVAEGGSIGYTDDPTPGGPSVTVTVRMPNSTATVFYVAPDGEAVVIA